DLVGWLGSSSPTAADFFAAITSGTGFAVVRTVQTIQPGDIIALKYAPGSHPTGHVMLVDGTPQHVAATAPRISGTEQWTVPVIDSSNSGHGPGDSRADSSGRFRTGVGRGTLRLFVAADGTVAGYSWSTLAASRFIPITERPL